MPNSTIKEKSGSSSSEEGELLEADDVGELPETPYHTETPSNMIADEYSPAVSMKLQYNQKNTIESKMVRRTNIEEMKTDDRSMFNMNPHISDMIKKQEKP